MNCNGSSYDLTRRGRRHLAKLALLAIIMAMCTLLPGLGQRASATTLPTRQACQVVLVPASTWLGGRGVDACKNIWGNDYSHSSGYGTEWQCVELAQAV